MVEVKHLKLPEVQDIKLMEHDNMFPQKMFCRSWQVQEALDQTLYVTIFFLVWFRFSVSSEANRRCMEMLTQLITRWGLLPKRIGLPVFRALWPASLNRVEWMDPVTFRSFSHLMLLVNVQ